MKRFFEFLGNFVTLDGRARRKEYWMLALFNLLILFSLSVVFVISAIMEGESSIASTLFSLLFLLYAIAVLFLTLAASVRRLHDTDRSGWWMLLVLIPYIGWLVLVIFFVMDGTVGENDYGDDPKGRSKERMEQPPVLPSGRVEVDTQNPLLALIKEAQSGKEVSAEEFTIASVEQLALLYGSTPKGEGFLTGSNAAKHVRLIGEMLYKIGGHQLMLIAHEAFAASYPVYGAARNLEMVWDGIGDWQG